MKRTYFLSVLLTLSIAANVFYLFKERPSQHPNFGDEQPFPVPGATAKAYHEKYVSTYNIPQNYVTGGVLSKPVIDEIFRNSQCNAITYSLGIDTIDSNGPQNREIFIVVSGAVVKYDSNGKIINPITTPADAKYYIPRNWCPPSCISYNLQSGK